MTRDVLLERYVEQPVGSALRHRLGGHVPGARNVPHSELLDAARGRFAPREVLLDRFAGLARTQDLVVYCDVGGRSALSRERIVQREPSDEQAEGVLAQQGDLHMVLAFWPSGATHAGTTCAGPRSRGAR